MARALAVSRPGKGSDRAAVGEARELTRSASVERLHPEIALARVGNPATVRGLAEGRIEFRGADRSRRRAPGKAADDECRSILASGGPDEHDRFAIRRDRHAAAVCELGRCAAANRDHPDRQRPADDRVEQHEPIVRRDHDRSGSRCRQSSHAATSRVGGPERQGSSADTDTNTIVRPSVVAAGLECIRDNLFGSALARRETNDRRTSPDNRPVQQPIAGPRDTRESDRHALRHVGPAEPALSPIQMSMRASRRAVTRPRRSPVRLTPM